MPSSLEKFEAIARAVARLPRQEPATQPAVEVPVLHPCDSRNIHPDLPAKVRELFDDGHFPEATSLVACRREFVTTDTAGGVGVFPLDRPCGGGVGVDVAAELAS